MAVIIVEFADILGESTVVELVGEEPGREDPPLPHHRAGSGPGFFRLEAP